ncbi:MAG TPA: integrase core domain-containing protein [Polyangiaceae bacterium]|nr:integrase core domain-containing protein [Polyangiaceae bacterium]
MAHLFLRGTGGCAGGRVAYREVEMIEVKEVLRRWRAGEAKKAIARALGIDPRTVRRYVKAAEVAEGGPGTADGGRGEPSETPLSEGTGSPQPPTRPQSALGDVDALTAAVLDAREAERSRPRGEAWALCEKHRDFLVEKIAARHMERPLKLTKILRLLKRERGVEVPYRTLHRFATEELGFGAESPTIPVMDGEPGEEIQLDTGWITRLEPDAKGVRRRVRAWIFTPVVSRYRFVWPCFEETTKTAIEACEAAWQFYGGVFGVLVPDNTKAIVTRADPLEPLFARAFLEYSQARDFVIDPTRSRHPRDKPRVERSVSSVRDGCFAGEKLFDLEGSRVHAERWSREDNGERPHSTTRRRPREHFESDEKAKLKPAPGEPYDVPVWSTVRVHPDQHIQVACSLYPLPVEFRRQTLTARADSKTVRVYQGARLVRTFPRLEKGKRFIDRSVFPPEKAAYAFRDKEWFEKRAREQGTFVGQYATTLLAGPEPWTAFRRVQSLLGLTKRYGAHRVDVACRQLLEAHLVNVKRLKRVLEQASTCGASAPLGTIVAQPQFLRPASDFALERPLAREASTTKEGETTCPKT